MESHYLCTGYSLAVTVSEEMGRAEISGGPTPAGSRTAQGKQCIPSPDGHGEQRSIHAGDEGWGLGTFTGAELMLRGELWG